MSSKINILLADDHQIIRDGVKALLDDQTTKVVGEADNGEQVKTLVQQHQVDIVLMDIKMPKCNGIEATSFLKEHYPNVKVLALSMFDDQSYIVNMLDAGAAGYILKNTGQAELMRAIKAIAQGESYYSDQVSSTLLNELIKDRHQKAKGDNENSSEPSIEVLTQREKEVLRLIAEENTNKEIAEKLYISPRTVDTHRRNLLQKLNVKNTAGLVKFAIKHNIIDN